MLDTSRGGDRSLLVGRNGDWPKAARGAGSKRILMASRELVPVLNTSFAGLPGLTPTVDRAVGEFELLLKPGYRAFGIAAGHRFHHTPADSPEMTGPEILEPAGGH